MQGIFRLYIEKQSILATASELNRRGWPRKIWTTKSGRTWGGGPWNKPNLIGLLRNVTYIGKVEYDGQTYAGEHEALLNDELWEAAQTTLDRNRQEGGSRVRNKYGALLRGLLVCGTCGCAMTHSYTAKGNTRYRYYVCQKAMKRGWQECETRSVPAQEIEDFVIQRIATIGKDPELAAEVARQAREEHQRQAEALRVEKTELHRSIREQARMVAGLFDQPNAAPRLANLQDQIQAGENRLAQIGKETVALANVEISEEDVAAALGHFAGIAETLTPIEKDRLIHLLVEQVVFNGVKSTVAITFRPTGIKTLNAEIV